MKMTKIEALNYTITLWQYLADHPEKGKHDAVKALNLPDDWPAKCPCCAYDHQFDGPLSCVHCPIWSRENPCHMLGGAFDKWLNNSRVLQLRSVAAQQIVDLAKAKLQEELSNEG
jgi:hypothetical protein